MKNNKRFDRTKEHEDAFQELKKLFMISTLCGETLDGESLLLYLLVSSNVGSVFLVIDLNRDRHPIYYVSKSLLDPETRYSHLEKLILALVTTS